MVMEMKHGELRKSKERKNFLSKLQCQAPASPAKIPCLKVKTDGKLFGRGVMGEIS